MSHASNFVTGRPTEKLIGLAQNLMEQKNDLLDGSTFRTARRHRDDPTNHIAFSARQWVREEFLAVFDGAAEVFRASEDMRSRRPGRTALREIALAEEIATRALADAAAGMTEIFPTGRR